jgi:hypothetical protein
MAGLSGNSLQLPKPTAQRLLTCGTAAARAGRGSIAAEFSLFSNAMQMFTDLVDYIMNIILA